MKIKTSIGPISLPGDVRIEAIVTETELETPEEIESYYKGSMEMFNKVSDLLTKEIPKAIKEVIGEFEGPEEDEEDRELEGQMSIDEMVDTVPFPHLVDTPNFSVDYNDYPQPKEKILPPGFKLIETQPE